MMITQDEIKRWPRFLNFIEDLTDRFKENSELTLNDIINVWTSNMDTSIECMSKLLQALVTAGILKKVRNQVKGYGHYKVSFKRR
jgi:ribosomal protein S17E